MNEKEEPSEVVKTGMRLASVLFTIVAICLVPIVVGRVIAASRSPSWPTAAGTIRESAIRSMRAQSTSYKPHVWYVYQVGGRAYDGERITLWDSGSSNRDTAEAVVKRYSPGSPVKVFYDPDRPERAVLEPGFRWITALFLLLPPVMATLGIIFWIKAKAVASHYARHSDEND